MENLVCLSAQKVLGEILAEAGVTINGNQPWNIQIHNEDMYEPEIDSVS